MVHEKSKHLLAEIYRGRLDGDIGDTAAFGDTYTMKRMSKEHPGKAAAAPAPFEFVSETNMDFENYKNRPEFSDEVGGEGSLYGASINRPDTPSSMFGDSHRGRSSSPSSERTAVGKDTGYHVSQSGLREYSSERTLRSAESNPTTPYQIPEDRNLLSSAAPMGAQTPNPDSGSGFTPYRPGDEAQRDYFRR